MIPLAEKLARDVDRLIQSSLDLDSWVRRSVGHEEELLAWHVGELLYDLRETESRMAEMVICRDRTIAKQSIREHYTNISDYIVPHWPLHVSPLRERTIARCGDTAKQGSNTSQYPGFTHKNLDPEQTETEAFECVFNAIHEFGLWLKEEELDGLITDNLIDFTNDIKLIHTELLQALPLRRFDELGPNLLLFCDDVDAMLARWQMDTIRITSWLDSHTASTEANADIASIDK